MLPPPLAPCITCWFGPIWSSLSMPIAPYCRRRLFGANLAVRDDPRNGFPTTAVPPRASHTSYRMQGYAFHWNRWNAGRESSWCKPYLECHYLICSYASPTAGPRHPWLYPGWRILLTRPATSYKPGQPAVSGMRITT